MSDQETQSYLKYALFCRDTEETPGDDLVLKGVIDLVDLPRPDSVDQDLPNPVLGGGGRPTWSFALGVLPLGPHRLLVAIKAPGAPLDPPPPEEIEWEEGILFNGGSRFSGYPSRPRENTWRAILLDGAPLGEAGFVVRFQDGA